MNIIKRKTCRVCGNAELRPLYSFGNLAVSTFLKDPYAEGILRCPLELIECGFCGLVQLRHTAPQELLYTSHYWFRSSQNPVIKADLEGIAVAAAAEVGGVGLGDTVLDIGANTGDLLAAYPDETHKVGCEPAKNLIDECGRNADEVIPDFWKAELFGERKAKIVTAIGMMYDMEDPNQFVADVAKVLAPDGVFVAQLMTLKQMIEKNDVGNVVHEHLEFYDYKALVYLFEQNGLEIYRVEENSINGGSYRLFARHLKTGSIPHPEPEVDWNAWTQRIERNRDLTMAWLAEERALGSLVYGYGASTKSSTILQWYGVDSRHLAGIAEKSAEKVGRYTAGSLIPIVHEDVARETADVFWILPYAFRDLFLEKEKKFRRKGKKIAFSTPDFEVL